MKIVIMSREAFKCGNIECDYHFDNFSDCRWAK